MNIKRPIVIDDNVFITEAIIQPHPYRQRKRDTNNVSSEHVASSSPSLRLSLKDSLKTSLLAQLTNLSFILSHSKELEKLPNISLYAEWRQAFTWVMKETLVMHARSIESSRGSIFSQFFEMSHRIGALSNPAYPFDGNVEDVESLIATIAHLEGGSKSHRAVAEPCCCRDYYMMHRSLGPVGSLAMQKLTRLGSVLASLSLVHCQLSDAHLLLLAKCMKSLQLLDVSRNAITNDGLTSLLRPFRYAASDAGPPSSGLCKLEFLGLAGNAQIYSKTECLALFEFLPSLMEIDLSDTGLAKLPTLSFRQFALYRRLYRSDALQTLLLSCHTKRSSQYQMVLDGKRWALDSALGPLSYTSLLHPVNYLLDMYIWNQYATIAVNELALPSSGHATSPYAHERILRVALGELKSRLKEEQAMHEKMNASKAGSWLRQRGTAFENDAQQNHASTPWLADFQSPSNAPDSRSETTASYSTSTIASTAISDPFPSSFSLPTLSSSSVQFPLMLVDLKKMAATSDAQGSVGPTPIESVATVRSLESQLQASLKKPIHPSPSPLSLAPKKQPPAQKKQCTLSNFFKSQSDM